MITRQLKIAWWHVPEKDKKMYKIPRIPDGRITSITCYEGESIESKVERISTNKEPIKDGAPIIYTERKDGVQPAYNIRTDRWEIATEAMDKVTASRLAKREERIKAKEAKVIDLNSDSRAESTQGTAETP